MDEYDITAAFKAIEDELIASMMRNMANHRAEEGHEGKAWSMWQAEQLKALEQYKRENQRKYRRRFQDINKDIDKLLRKARETGGMEQEKEILEAMKKGFFPSHSPDALTAEFFRLNDRKLEALIQATAQDMEKAEVAVLRRANDQYRKAIFNAQVYANTGAGTYEKAVDMATKDMLSAGLNCIVYANGARHTLSDYADMAIRTASKRAYLQGEGDKRREWGISTVILAKRGNPCPMCRPFVGKVFIDDIWSGGKASDKKYPLLSGAVAAGLYHPRCKDSHTTYFPGISTADDTWTEEELKAVDQANREEISRQYSRRQAEKFGRLATYSLDEENKRKYQQKAEEWQEQADIRKTINQKMEQVFDHEPVSIFAIKSPYRDELDEALGQTPENVKRILLKYQDEIVLINEVALQTREGIKGIRINLKKDRLNKRGKWTGLFHEMGHRIDRLSGRPSQNPQFEVALENDFETLVKNYQRQYNKNRIVAYEEIGKRIKNPEYHSISDLFGAMSNNQCKGTYSHPESGYWDKPGRLGKEAFAHFFEAVSRGDEVKKGLLKQAFPQAFSMFERMLEGC